MHGLANGESFVKSAFPIANGFSKSKTICSHDWDGFGQVHFIFIILLPHQELTYYLFEKYASNAMWPLLNQGNFGSVDTRGVMWSFERLTFKIRTIL